MAKKATRQRGKPENPRKFKKKVSPLTIDKIDYVDFKDVDLLSRFMSDRAKIRNMRVTGNDRQQQLEVANAIKNAREMALLPYTKRVASAGRNRPSRDDRRRDNRPESADTDVDGDVDVNIEVPEGAEVEIDIETTEDEV